MLLCTLQNVAVTYPARRTMWRRRILHNVSIWMRSHQKQIASSSHCIYMSCREHRMHDGDTIHRLHGVITEFAHPYSLLTSAAWTTKIKTAYLCLYSTSASAIVQYTFAVSVHVHLFTRQWPLDACYRLAHIRFPETFTATCAPHSVIFPRISLIRCTNSATFVCI